MNDYIFKQLENLYISYLDAVDSMTKVNNSTIGFTSEYFLGNRYDKEVILNRWQQDMISKGWDNWIYKQESDEVL